ncbi:MAG: hypothetical protein LAO77_08465 [Acidobacteriia bacterium]|nr:hypothetical protein [Terriglobia bacterium]
MCGRSGELQRRRHPAWNPRRLGGRPSSHVTPVAESLRALALNVSIETVPYEFQRGGNQMMRVRAKPGAVR